MRYGITDSDTVLTVVKLKDLVLERLKSAIRNRMLALVPRSSHSQGYPANEGNVDSGGICSSIGVIHTVGKRRIFSLEVTLPYSK